MNYAQRMHFDGSILRRHFRTALLGVALGFGAHGLVAGEPIRFSGRAGLPAQQDFDRREPLLPAEARSFTRPNQAMDTILTPVQPVTPTTGLTRRQLEAQEQKRNWIFQSSETILRQSTERDDAQHDRNDREKPKSSVERFIEGADSKADPAGQTTKSGDSSPRSTRDRKDTAGNTTHSTRADGTKSNEDSTDLEMRRTGNSRGLGEVNFFGGADARNGSIGRAMSEARDRQRDRDASLDAFKRTLNNPWAQPAAGGADPSRVVGNTSPGNVSLPTVGIDRHGVGGPLGQPGRSVMDLGPRGGLGDFDPKNPLNYGAPETVLRNNEPQRVAPKPVILEVPKRKF